MTLYTRFKKKSSFSVRESSERLHALCADLIREQPFAEEVAHTLAPHPPCLVYHSLQTIVGLAPKG